MASIISAGTTSGTSLNLSGDTSGVLQLATNGSTTAITVDTSQRVGIGTASPAASLHVAGAISNAPTGSGVLAGIQSDYAVIHLNGSAATGSFIDFSTSGTDSKGRILYDNTSNYMKFDVDAAERMRIDSSGNVGIGTISPQMRVDVGSGGIRVQGIANPSSGSGMELAYDGTQGIIQAYSNRATLTAVPVYLVTGQLKFPPTQVPSSDPTTLDDYEEGTWTPQAGSDAGAFTATYTGQAGRYVKIGNRVWATFDFILASRTLTGSVAVIYGLPFSVASNGDLSGSFGSVALSQNTGVNFNYLGLYAQNASSFIYVTYTTTATNNISIAPNTFFGSVTRVSGGVMYNTTS